MKKLGDEVSTHIARKTFIAISIQAGVSEKVICEMSGHITGSRSVSRYKREPIDLMKKAIADFLGLNVKSLFS